MKRTAIIFGLLSLCSMAFAQRYNSGVIDKAAAVVGNELIMLSDVENELKTQRMSGMGVDQASRCTILESMMTDKLFVMQARLDSLSVNAEMANSQLNAFVDQWMYMAGGQEQLEKYFGKPLSELRRAWKEQMENQNLRDQEKSEIIGKIPELTPYDVKQYMDTVDRNNLPVVPIKYKMSQICVYPDREAAKLACKERLLSIRERIINGEKFATLARLYSEDPGSARKGGELGMASKSIFWPAFSDAAMSLKPGSVSQIVETPDGFHIIQVIEKSGDQFNARHILLKPRYTDEDQAKGFARLDSLKALIDSSKITFEMAARLYSEDPASRTNGGQMSDPNTGSAYFEIDQLKPEDYAAVKDLEPGQVSDPIVSRDNEGRDGNLVYKIVRLDKIVPAHTATMEHDYTELMQGVKNQKQNEALNEFVDSKIKDTYIIIDPIFKDCDFSRKGWAEKIRK